MENQIRVFNGKRHLASVEICDSLGRKFRGLMFSKKRDLIFIFKRAQRISLHMLFVFFPIWVVYLDGKKQVVFFTRLLPFVSSCYPSEKAKYVLELTLKPLVKIGDTLSWQNPAKAL